MNHSSTESRGVRRGRITLDSLEQTLSDENASDDGLIRSWVRLLMQCVGMSIATLARRTGYSPPDVSRSLTRSGNWTLHRVRKYASALIVTPAELLDARSSLEEAYEVITRPVRMHPPPDRPWFPSLNPTLASRPGRAALLFEELRRKVSHEA